MLQEVGVLLVQLIVFEPGAQRRCAGLGLILGDGGEPLGQPVLITGGRVFLFVCHLQCFLLSVGLLYGRNTAQQRVHGLLEAQI